ncbi:TetR/AcrR family transcriptional regulator [Nocardia elegans]|uniref:TetR/AcrR family transcriptional regulator n=1 Tax=Nocardia elegans TaxID=300029 RepID=A0ABW6TDB2_9NOCA|nr:TetR/AcrR family transcriptional regulator [Nocardia elegans]MBF6446316.1 TetR/AcrR family transcriptional regulator [Nocardia elegans]
MAATAAKGGATRAERAAESRRRLVDAAVGLFSEQNYENVAVGDIAKAAGVAHGLVFHHFGNKRGIYLEAMREASNRIVRAQTSDPGLPLARRIRAGLAAHLRYLAAHRGLALRLVLGGHEPDQETWEAFEVGRWRTIGQWATALGLDPDNAAVRMMMRSSIGALDQATVYWLRNGEPFEVESMVDCILELTAAALRAAARLDPALDVNAGVSALLDALEDR